MPPLPPRDRHGFTVAIICALPLEADAVLQIFDVDWSAHGKVYGSALNDSNVYTTGAIGAHNVVLAHGSGMGTVSTTSVASNLRHSFLNIELALLVGICGAAPHGPQHEKDVFLGDLVVSTAAVQTDFGRQGPNQLDRKRGIEDSLGRPNEKIRSLIAQLRTNHYSHKISQLISEILLQSDSLLPARSFPGRNRDHLYESTYLHKHRRDAGNGSRCTDCMGGIDRTCLQARNLSCHELGCEASRLIERSRQPDNNDSLTHGYEQPQVHFGRVASSNAVMRSGRHRDDITKQEGVIAFEMELAGTWDQLPSILVKGVCDYADSHKNKEWQAFAAMVAAAGAKAILQIAEPRNVDEDSVEFLRGRSLLLEGLRFDAMNARVNEIVQSDKDTFGWLFDKDLEGSHQEKWSSFLLWLNQPSEIFWIHGKPGSGKSTLMRHIWQHEKTQEILQQAYPSRTCHVLKYAFWLSGTYLQRTLKGLYLSLLHQLLTIDLRCSKELLAEFPSLWDKRSPDDWSENELEGIFNWAVKEVGTRAGVCIFIDGMDELDGRERFAKAIRLIEQCVASNVKVCISSRPEAFWKRRFEHCQQLRVQDLTRGDIKAYILSRLREGGHDIEHLVPADTSVTTIQNAAREVKLVWAIRSKAEGVFLWVHLIMNDVLEALDAYDSWEQVVDLVDQTPSDIHDMYSSMLAKRGGNNPRALDEASIYFKMCILRHTFTMDAFLGVKARFDGDCILQNKFTQQKIQDTFAVLRERVGQICAGLVSISIWKAVNDPSSSIVAAWVESTSQDFSQSSLPSVQLVLPRFPHRSVRDFLLTSDMGQTLLQRATRSNKIILQGSTEGILKCATFDGGDSLAIRVTRCLEAIQVMRDDRDLCMRTEDIDGALSTIDEMYLEILKGMRGREMVSEDTREAWFELRLSPRQHTLSKFLLAIDITGLSLEFGIDARARKMLQVSEEPSIPPNPRLAQEYKDYLLFCAFPGHCNEQGAGNVALKLLQAGANPFAEMNSPKWLPTRPKAIDKLISHFYSLRSSDLLEFVPEWTKILELIAASRVYRQVASEKSLVAVYLPHPRFFLKDTDFALMMSGELTRPHFHMTMDIRTTAHVEYLLTQLKSDMLIWPLSIPPGNDTFTPQHCLIYSPSRGWNFHDHDNDPKVPYVALDEQQSGEMYEALRLCRQSFREIGQNPRESDIRFDQAQEKRSELVDRLIQYYNADPTQQIPIATLLDKIGYTQAKADAVTYTAPLRQFEQSATDDVDDKTKQTPIKRVFEDIS